MIKKTLLSVAGVFTLAVAVIAPAAAGYAVGGENAPAPKYNQSTETYDLADPNTAELITPMRYALNFEKFESKVSLTEASVAAQDISITTAAEDPFKDVVVLKFPNRNEAGDVIQNVVTVPTGTNVVYNIQDGVDETGAFFTQVVMTNSSDSETPQFNLKVETYNAFSSQTGILNVPVFVKIHKEQKIQESVVNSSAILTEGEGNGVDTKSSVTENLSLKAKVANTANYLPVTPTVSTDAASYQLDGWKYDESVIQAMKEAEAKAEAERPKTPEEIAAEEERKRKTIETLSGIGLLFVLGVVVLIAGKIAGSANAQRYARLKSKNWYETFDPKNIAFIPEKEQKELTVQEYGTHPNFTDEFDGSLFSNMNGENKPVGFTFTEPTLDDGTKIDYHLYPFLAHELPGNTAMQTSILALLYGCVAKGALVFVKQKDGRGAISLPDNYDINKINALNPYEKETYDTFIRVLLTEGTKPKESWMLKSFNAKLNEPDWFTEAKVFKVEPENANLMKKLSSGSISEKLTKQVQELALFKKQTRKVRTKAIFKTFIAGAALVAITGLGTALLSGMWSIMAIGGVISAVMVTIYSLVKVSGSAYDIEDTCRSAKGTAYLARMQMYKNYLMIVDSDSRYSSEKSDINGSVLPWTVVFNMQNVWADVFAVDTRPNFIQLGEEEIPTLYFKRILNTQVNRIESANPSKTDVLSHSMF